MRIPICFGRPGRGNQKRKLFFVVVTPGVEKAYAFLRGSAAPVAEKYLYLYVLGAPGPENVLIEDASGDASPPPSSVEGPTNVVAPLRLGRGA